MAILFSKIVNLKRLCEKQNILKTVKTRRLLCLGHRKDPKEKAVKRIAVNSKHKEKSKKRRKEAVRMTIKREGLRSRKLKLWTETCKLIYRTFMKCIISQ